jgi:hypothetical protein
MPKNDNNKDGVTGIRVRFEVTNATGGALPPKLRKAISERIDRAMMFVMAEAHPVLGPMLSMAAASAHGNNPDDVGRMMARVMEQMVRTSEPGKADPNNN